MYLVIRTRNIKITSKICSLNTNYSHSHKVFDMSNWKLKLTLPIIYFIATLGLFYFIASNRGFLFDKVQIASIGLTVISFILWITSRIQLGSAFSLAPKTSYLVTTGVYSKVRHPVYVFSFLVFAGISLFLKEWILLIPLLLVLCMQLFRISKEDTLLEQRFGEKFRKYRRTTWF